MSRGAHAATGRAGTGRPEVRRARAPRGRVVRFGYIPSLDGLRALAVLGVMMYHGGSSIFDGGFLTIDVFFVLSGFLITSLLVGEWGKTLTIRLGQFWARRARRLLPALLVMLLGVCAYAKWLATPGEFVDLRLDVLSTLLYVANWHFILDGNNYFSQTAQTSPLQHMWSLSIEEQFYLVWPPIALALLVLGSRLRPSRRLWPLGIVAVVGAVASAVDMRLLYHGPSTVMRVYEGTDTRAQDLLVGAALAVGMAIWAQHRPALPVDRPGGVSATGRLHPAAGNAGTTTPPPRRRRGQRHRRGPVTRPISAWELGGTGTRIAVQVAGWAAIGVTAYYWSHLHGPTAFLFRGGYFLVALSVAVVIFSAVTNQAGLVARALANPVFRYVGKISYGAYLWHFPLFEVLDASRVHLLGYPLLAVRIGTTLLVATASFYLVEEPVRRKRFHLLTEWRAFLVTSAAFVGVALVTIAATLPNAAAAASVTAAHPDGSAYEGVPVKVQVFGDSVSWRLTEAMELAQAEQAYDVDFDNGAIFGCGVLRTTEYRSHGVIDDMTQQCNSSAPLSEQWPALWRGELDRFRPNVTVLLAGRWEVMSRNVDGRWTHIGEPAFDAALRASLRQAVEVGTSTGALMVLLTAPCYDSGEQPNGQPWPEDSATRLRDYNDILRQVAAEFPTRVTVVNFGADVCPGGHFEMSIDGVQIRDADGVHIAPTPAAGAWLARRVLPPVVAAGRLQMAGRTFAPPRPSRPVSAPTTPGTPERAGTG